MREIEKHRILNTKQMSESETAKLQLREHLASILIPPVTEGFWSVQKTANDLCERNKQPSEVLRTFQNMLTKIPEWNESVLTDEVDRILNVSKCTYLDDLLMGVFLAYMKSFAALQYRGQSSQIKIEFERPNVPKFIHELYKQSARKLWQSAYLFKTNIPTEQQSRNRKEVEEIVYKAIDDVVRVFLPWESITKAYFVQPNEEPVVPKNVIFEDVSEDESEESEEELLPAMNIAEDIDDKLSVTDLDQKEEIPETKSITIEDPLKEIESKMSEDSLVLNL